MRSKKNKWARVYSPDKCIPEGTLVRFVHAPGRFKGEGPRSPGHDLMGEVAIVLSKEEVDYHNWGGIFRLCGQDGITFRHHGDFLEIVQ